MPAPLILFGAFDRHNFGDLLFPRLAAALWPGRRLLLAGVATRDLRALGGPHVLALPVLLQRLGKMRADLLHVGGEILDCPAWDAAVMLQSAEAARSAVAAFDAQPAARAAWAAQVLGTRALAPYVASRVRYPQLGRIGFDAVGGVALGTADPALRHEVSAALAAADVVGVREARTGRLLEQTGIHAGLGPDPAVLVARLSGGTVARHAARGPVAALRRRFPQGYLALQFSADCGADGTLDTLAAELGRLRRRHPWGIVLFRAGAAPWHDDLAVYRRLMQRLEAGAALCFCSLQPWDICALIAGAAACAGSSLHARIVATAFARPRISLRGPGDGQSAKVDAYLASWELAGQPGSVAMGSLADALELALGVAPARLHACADTLVAARYQALAPLREAFRQA